MTLFFYGPDRRRLNWDVPVFGAVAKLAPVLGVDRLRFRLVRGGLYDHDADPETVIMPVVNWSVKSGALGRDRAFGVRAYAQARMNCPLPFGHVTVPCLLGARMRLVN